MTLHQAMAATLDAVIAEIHGIQRDARTNGFRTLNPAWPLIILVRRRAGEVRRWWTASRRQGSFRSHQVPMGDMNQPEHVALLERWMKSYSAGGIVRRSGPFDARSGRTGSRRGASHECQSTRQWGTAPWDSRLPDFRDYAVTVDQPGGVDAEATRVQGQLVRDADQVQPCGTSAFQSR